MVLSFDQIRKYFEARLDRSLPAREKIAVRCPFHDDKTPSATVFLSGNGGFNCNGCGAKGNIVQFEARLKGCDLETAKSNIAALTGATPEENAKGICTAVYDYRRTDGTVVFQKRRYEHQQNGKSFYLMRPEGKGWAHGIGEVARVLYNLPALVTCNLAFIAEGEKDCDNLTGLELWPDRPDLRIAATCNFEGAWKPGQAPKWLGEYSRYFAGKQVVVFEDNDEAGRTWADHVCASVQPFAEAVRRVSFPDLAEKSDVSDFLENHSPDELAKRITKAPRWMPEESQATRRRVFVDFPEFATQSSKQIDWMVGGLIERGANGFIAAEPKIGKSFVTADLCMALATGTSWLDFAVPHPVKVGLVSREDNPRLTAWRLRHLMEGRSLNVMQMNYLESNLYVNSRAQTPTLMLDSDEEMAELYDAIRERQLEIVFFDVLNVMHGSDENDNTQMTQVMAKLRKVQAETGAAVGVIHHFKKEESERITQRLRGASAIAGFTEWMIGISMADAEAQIRKMEFEIKAAQPPEAVFYAIESNGDGPIKIRRVSMQPQPSNHRTAKGLFQ